MGVLSTAEQCKTDRHNNADLLIFSTNFFIDLTTKENPQQTFGILADGELCGVIGLVLQKDVYRLTAEIGYWIGEQYWGKGITTKAIELITKYGFEDLALERLHAGVFDFNSCKCIFFYLGTKMYGKKGSCPGRGGARLYQEKEKDIDTCL